MAVFQSSSVQVEERIDGVALLRLDVPGKSFNLFDRAVLADLENALAAIEAVPTFNLLVLRSDKASGFVAGADIGVFSKIRSAEEAQELAATGQRVFGKLASLRLPSVAIVHGPCLGG